MRQHTLSVLIVGSVVAFFAPLGVSALEGTIDEVFKHAWGENTGWVNFRAPSSNVVVNDTQLTGFVWSDNYGWIDLNPATAGVTNTRAGVLGGDAWGEQTGFIDFSGVTIDTSGFFHGFATSAITGQISMNCANTTSCTSSDFKVKTNWVPESARAECDNGVDDDDDGLIDFPNDPGCQSLTDTTESDGSVAGSSSGNGPQSPRIHINDNATSTQHHEVVLALHVIGGTEMRISNNPNFNARSWEPYTTRKTWLLLPGDGTKTVYAQFRNDSGKKTATVFDDILVIGIDELEGEDVPIMNNDPLLRESVGECEPYLNSFIKLDGNNDSQEVEKLETFLRDYEGYTTLVPDGVYDRRSHDTVHAFQKKYSDDVLFPWRISESTGYVFVTTRTAINRLHCIYRQQALIVREPLTRPFSVRLGVGDIHEDVARLQRFLNTVGVIVAETGPGSSGNETTFYGAQTSRAVARFQVAHGILTDESDDGYGVFGQATQARANIISFGFETQ